jgi:hypothetical protein
MVLKAKRKLGEGKKRRRGGEKEREERVERKVNYVFHGRSRHSVFVYSPFFSQKPAYFNSSY